MTQLRSYANSTAPAPARVAHRSKVIVALLAAVLGAFGAHWWYLGRPKAWMVTTFSCLMIILAQFYPSWWENTPFFLLIIPIADGFIEALVFALKPDEQFDAKYNPLSLRATHTGWAPVLIAIFTTMLGGVVVTFWIAMVVVYVYTSMGWLDGFVF